MSNGGPRNPKLTLKFNGLWTKLKPCQRGVKQTHVQNLKKKRKFFFLSQGHFTELLDLELTSKNNFCNLYTKTIAYHYYHYYCLQNTQCSFGLQNANLCSNSNYMYCIQLTTTEDEMGMSKNGLQTKKKGHLCRKLKTACIYKFNSKRINLGQRRRYHDNNDDDNNNNNHHHHHYHHHHHHYLRSRK